MGKIIYRYIDWDNNDSKKLMTNDELYFYSAEPWEVDGEYGFELTDFNEKEVSDVILEIAVEMHNENREEYNSWLEFHANRYGVDLDDLSAGEIEIVDQTFAARIASEIVSDPNEFIRVQRKSYFDQTGIVSFSESKHSYGLWNSKRSGSSGNIVCVGIDLCILENFLKNVPTCRTRGVNYSKESPEYKLIRDKVGSKNFDQLLEIVFYILPKYGTESEIRVMRLLDDRSIESKERKIPLPEGIFKEVIILDEANEETKREIEEWTAEKNISKIQSAHISSDDQCIYISDT